MAAPHAPPLSPAAPPRPVRRRTQTVGSPFPDHVGPSAAACQSAVAALLPLHGPVRRGPRQGGASCGEISGVLEALVRTILSQNTTQANATRAMRGLIARFGRSWPAAVHRAPAEELAASIACGGLAHTKSRYIKTILAELWATRGSLSLDYLRGWSDDAAILAELTAFDGVGIKTAGCVLLFCLQRDVFAVDTHIFRIAKRLGWVPLRANRIQAQHHLDARVPKSLKHPLHVLLVRHGKTCMDCAANQRPQRPSHVPCPLLKAL